MMNYTFKSKNGWVNILVMYFSVGCVPFYDAEYTFIAPTTAKGETCIAQCDTSKRQCEYLEKKKTAYCSLQLELPCDEGEINQPLTNRRRCESHYRRCYEACGGRVTNL
jgi:hypothetical protein